MLKKGHWWDLKWWKHTKELTTTCNFYFPEWFRAWTRVCLCYSIKTPLVYIVQDTKFCMITSRVKVVLFVLLLTFNNNIKYKKLSGSCEVYFYLQCPSFDTSHKLLYSEMFGFFFNLLLLGWNISNLKNFQCPIWSKEG